MSHVLEFERPIYADETSYWVTLHYLEDQCMLAQIGTLQQALNPKNSRNVEWLQIAKQPGHGTRKIRTKLFGPFDNLKDAEATAYVVKAIHRPSCNMVNDTEAVATSERRMVVCRETGRIFPSRNAAARFYQLDPSALGRHLKRQTGFRSVKGREFVYYDELSPEAQEEVRRMDRKLQET